MAEQPRRLVISDDDLVGVTGSQSAVPAAPAPPAPAETGALPGGGGPASYPSVAGVKPPPLKLGGTSTGAAPGLNLGGTVISSAVAGLASILVGWVVVEVLTNPDGGLSSESAAVRHSAWVVGVLGLVFGALYSSWDKLTARLWEAALPQAGLGALIGGVAGAISGAIAQSTFHSIVISILRHSGLDASPHDVRFYLARALAWAIFGVAIGAAAAAAQRSTRKLVNACLGGLAGGAAGGLFFHWLVASETVHSGSTARFLSFAVIGGGIGLAIGLIETARRQAWLKIVAGGMTGKEFIVYHANANVGSSPKCEITLIKDPGIGAYHFRIDDQGGRRSLSVYEGCTTTVNGRPVTTHALRDGDVIQVGSTSIRYSERAIAQ